MDELTVIFEALYHTYQKNLEHFEKLVASVVIEDETQQFEILYHSLATKVKTSKQEVNLFLECLCPSSRHDLSKRSQYPIESIH